jgi:hypothetical protein
MSALAAKVSGMGKSCDARSTAVISQRENQSPRLAVSKDNGQIDEVSLRKQWIRQARAAPICCKMHPADFRYHFKSRLYLSPIGWSAPGQLLL